MYKHAFLSSGWVPGPVIWCRSLQSPQALSQAATEEAGTPLDETEELKGDSGDWVFSAGLDVKSPTDRSLGGTPGRQQWPQLAPASQEGAEMTDAKRKDCQGLIEWNDVHRGQCPTKRQHTQSPKY